MRWAVFDLDGVIIDSKSNMRAAWKRVQDKHNVKTEFDSYFALIGRPFSSILLSLGLSHDLREIQQTYFSATASNSQLITFYPEIKNTILELSSQGVSLAVLTSKPLDRTTDVIARLGLTFDVIMTPESGMPGKPNPDQLQEIIKITKAGPEDALFVGDMDVDRLCAERAGVRFVHACWGYGKCEAGENSAFEPRELLRYFPNS